MAAVGTAVVVEAVVGSNGSGRCGDVGGGGGIAAASYVAAAVASLVVVAVLVVVVGVQCVSSPPFYVSLRSQN